MIKNVKVATFNARRARLLVLLHVQAAQMVFNTRKENVFHAQAIVRNAPREFAKFAILDIL